MVILAYTIATIGGLLAWVPAAKLSSRERRVRALRWASVFALLVVVLVAIAGVIVGVNRLGIVGIPIGLAVAGYFALFASVTGWVDSTMMQVASDSLDARFESNPDLEDSFRRNWFLKRILRNMKRPGKSGGSKS